MSKWVSCVTHLYPLSTFFCWCFYSMVFIVCVCVYYFLYCRPLHSLFFFFQTISKKYSMFHHILKLPILLLLLQYFIILKLPIPLLLSSHPTNSLSLSLSLFLHHLYSSLRIESIDNKTNANGPPALRPHHKRREN